MGIELVDLKHLVLHHEWHSIKDDIGQLGFRQYLRSHAARAIAHRIVNDGRFLMREFDVESQYTPEVKDKLFHFTIGIETSETELQAAERTRNEGYDAGVRAGLKMVSGYLKHQRNFVGHDVIGFINLATRALDSSMQASAKFTPQPEVPNEQDR